MFEYVLPGEKKEGGMDLPEKGITPGCLLALGKRKWGSFRGGGGGTQDTPHHKGGRVSLSALGEPKKIAAKRICFGARGRKKAVPA